MDAHCIGPTVPTWSPALCRTCDRFEFWICFYFQTWFQSWSSWSHFVQLISLFKILWRFRWRFSLIFSRRFSWRFLQLVKFSDFWSRANLNFSLIWNAQRIASGVVLSVMLPPSCLLWYRATIFLFYMNVLSQHSTAPLRTDHGIQRATKISSYEHIVQK